MILFPVTPIRNQNINAVYHAPAIPPEICDRILASLDEKKWEKGTVGSANSPQGFEQNSAVRSMVQQRLPVDQSGFPLNIISQVVAQANSQLWNFDLSGMVMDDYPWAMKYTAEMKGHYDWHVDVGRGANASRKLGFTLQLTDGSEYEGGDLEFHNVPVDKKILRGKGAVGLFPAFWLHRVAPVTKGTRVAVVGWIHGPSFR